MKTIRKISALILSVLMIASLAACGGSAKEFTFEAENAVINCDGFTVETGPSLLDGKDGGEITNVGNFGGGSMTWTITSDKDCDATVTLYGASCAMTFGESGMSLLEIDMASANGSVYKLTNNGTACTLTGKLPGTENLNMEDPTAWRNMGTVTANVKLVKGENKIVFEIVGTLEGAFGSGINFDKMVISAPAELTWNPTNNG